MINENNTKEFYYEEQPEDMREASPRYTQHEEREQGKYGKTKENNTGNHAPERGKIVTSKTAWDDAE